MPPICLIEKCEETAAVIEFPGTPYCVEHQSNQSFKEKKLAEFDKQFDAHYFYEYPNEEIIRVATFLSKSIEESYQEGNKDGMEEGKLLQSIWENDPLHNPKGAYNEGWEKGSKQAREEERDRILEWARDTKNFHHEDNGTKCIEVDDLKQFLFNNQ